MIADFICPTPETRAAFGDDAFIIWLDRIEAGRFEDTNRMFVAPDRFDLRVGAEGAPQFWANTRSRCFGRRSTRSSRLRCSSDATSRFIRAISG